MFFEQQSPRFVGIDMASGWIRDLEGSDSRLHKERVIEKALMAAKLGSADAQCFLFNCFQAYNPFYVFNIKQVPETQGLTGRPNHWPKFWALLESLRTRSTTGNDARRAIQSLAEDFDSDEWNLLARRVLIKDLRCGISEKTLNKILGRTEWAIPVFGCQLAQDSTDHPAKLKGIKRLEVKLDGIRVLAVVNGSNVTLYSRNGKLLTNFTSIANDIADESAPIGSYKGINATKYVLDGEIVGDNFQTLMQQAHKKSNAKTHNMIYHIFDIIPFEDFEKGYYHVPQVRRTSILEKLRPRISQTKTLRIMPGIEVDLNIAQGHETMNRFAQEAISQGYEGIMIKNLDASYECKRSSSWLKWKPVMSVDLTVVGFEEGTGRNQGRLGALICEGVDNERSIRVNVGSGFSDVDRDQYWIDRDRLVNRIVEIQADSVTQNQDGSYSLRFPRFLRFRGNLPGEKF
jgi:DNA ligase-1